MLITVNMIAGQETLRPLCPELAPLLSLQLPEGWTRRPLSDGRESFGVSFGYGSGSRDSVSISYWDGTPNLRFQTWVYGHTDKRYDTLEEAIDRAKWLMPIVARGVHWSHIASVRNEEYGMSLIERNGIGKVAITRLLDRFDNLEGLLEASLEDIEAIKGIGEDKAWLIASHLYPNVLYRRLWDPEEEEWIELYQVPKEIIDQCVRTRTYLSESVRRQYRLPVREIRERGLVKERR